jgi:uncharacterized membrane protein YhhN
VVDLGLAAPVIIYAAIIGFMLLTALHTGTGKRIKRVAYQNFIPGALLFIISDSLLAVDKFGIIGNDKTLQAQAHLLSAVFIMITYGFAQLLIILGAIRIIRR